MSNANHYNRIPLTLENLKTLNPETDYLDMVSVFGRAWHFLHAVRPLKSFDANAVTISHGTGPTFGMTLGENSIAGVFIMRKIS